MSCGRFGSSRLWHGDLETRYSTRSGVRKGILNLIKHWLLLSKVEYLIELSKSGELRPRPEDHIVFETLGIQKLTVKE